MNFIKKFKQSIFDINDKTFVDSSLAAYDYQYYNSEIYRSYNNYLKKSPKTVKKIEDIPFLPITFFKNHIIKTGFWDEDKIFRSSGTAGTTKSSHYICSTDFYHALAKKTFEQQFGSLKEFQLIALLPSYLEQGNSSLINMIDYFIDCSNNESGYFTEKTIGSLLTSKTRKLVIGVSYALLDLSKSGIKITNAIVIETGGMKGRKKEMTRTELHNHLKKGFGMKNIWSEYGMTELLSQAYGIDGLFSFPKWAKCMLRDTHDPFNFIHDNRIGGINIIDLGNIDSCCFIETKDLGRIKNDYFEVLGRFDNSDIRGCNLMI